MPKQDILVENLNGPGRRLRLAVVTETFPPEINGVSLTLSRMVDGLRALGHELEIIRPAQPSDEQLPLPPFDQLLTKGVAIPRYPGLRMGMPAKRRLVPPAAPTPPSRRLAGGGSCSTKHLPKKNKTQCSRALAVLNGP